jgi:hypothetical protein
MTKQQYQVAYDDAEESDVGSPPLAKSRRAANRNGVLRGYLAHAHGKSTGWCNANGRSNSPVERGERYE